jgi:integrase
MGTSYDVRIWKTEVYTGARTSTHTVRWTVAGTPWRAPFKTAALADAFRSGLVSAARKGEAFIIATGRPTSMQWEQRKVRWLDFATRYVDMKWPHLAPNSRRNTARALTNATFALIVSDRGRPTDAEIRKALTSWAFNGGARRKAGGTPPAALAPALRWLDGNTRDMADLAEPAVSRATLNSLTKRLDGAAAAAGTVQRQRGVLVNLAEYAIEERIFETNPLTSLAWKVPKTVKSVDKRVVVNPDQGRALLRAVSAESPSGARLVAFFGAMYFAALRPAEAATLRRSNLILPAEGGWGELLIEFSTPTAGASWTDTGVRREQRQLKHRAKGETRSVPSPPELTTLLTDHLATFGTTAGGLLFRGIRQDQLAESTYARVWRKARVKALTKEEAASPLAGRPYDLRHAAVSTWLNAGVPSTQVAEWAGHSVGVLHQIYAKCIVGQEEAAKKRIADALGSIGPAA